MSRPLIEQAHTDLAQFPEREDRMRYLARVFRGELRGRVLDVGCDVRHLKKLVPDVDYFGIDFGGSPDLSIDLDRTERLPFDDGQFDVVVCSEVLEHLDNLHRTFAELVRVSRGQLIISIPNCWAAARRPLARGKGAIGHYGLPAERPKDRHKWFFSLTEGLAFCEAQAQLHGLVVQEVRVCEKPRFPALRMLRRLRYPVRARYLNLYAHTLWVRFEKAGVKR